MPDATYDAIIVGAGCNGLCTASYLQRAGLKVAVCERRHEEAGGVNTEEPLTQGFYHNMHAQYMEFIDYMPFYHDFELWKFGARFIRPEVQHGITFADGRPPLVLHHYSLLDRTHKSIARHSKADADLWVDLKRKIMDMDPLVPSILWNPPIPAVPGTAGGFPGAATPELYAQILEDLGLDPYLLAKSPKECIEYYFESTELRALLFRMCPEWGTDLLAEGGGPGFLFSVMWMSCMNYLSVGGTHTLGHAMAQAALHEGVDIRDNADVAEITIDGGRATGVRLEDGTTLAATKLVASNADVRQTLLDLVGEENLSPLWAKRAKNFHYGPTQVLGTTAWCLHEAPNYKSARWDPDINKCFYTLVGYENADEMLQYIKESHNGVVPTKPAAGTWVNSLWDPSQAPAGKHSATGWIFLPCASELTEPEWKELRRSYNAKLLDVWGDYAPNMTRANVLSDCLYTPDQMVWKNRMQEGDFANGRFSMDQLGPNRPFPEASQYRTEIQDLYLCGPGNHPGGGMGAYCGYNAFKIIAEDYDLPKLWEQTDRILY